MSGIEAQRREKELKQEIAPLILADLDDTLFQTLRKVPDGVDHDSLRPASWMKDGSISGYMTPLQSFFHGWLAQGEVIPVTARNRLVMERTFLKGCGRAVCSHGGLILDKEGQTDRRWKEHLIEEGKSSWASPEEAYSIIRPLIDGHGDRLRHWMISEEGLDLYITIKQNRPDEGEPIGDERLHDIGAEALSLLPQGWKLHCNGNNVALMPSWLGKRQAVEYLLEDLREESPSRPVIGFGDSTSDLPFMAVCDYMMTPSRSQVAKLLAEAARSHH